MFIWTTQPMVLFLNRQETCQTRRVRRTQEGQNFIRIGLSYRTLQTLGRPHRGPQNCLAAVMPVNDQRRKDRKHQDEPRSSLSMHSMRPRGKIHSSRALHRSHAKTSALSYMSRSQNAEERSLQNKRCRQGPVQGASQLRGHRHYGQC